MTRLSLAAVLFLVPSALAQPRPVTLPEGARVEKDIVYARPPEKELLLDLYLPAPGPDPAPVLLWVHGGAWRVGSKENPHALRLLSRGYAVAAINYRLSQVARFPAQLHDCKAAVRWLRANAARYRLDPERIGTWGESAGGHLVALLGTTGDVSALEGGLGNADQSSRVQAVVDFYGPSDFLTMDAQGSRSPHNAPDSPESLLVGGAIQEHPDLVRRASPLAYVSRDDPPFLVVHGDRDFTVPLGQGTQMHDALRTAGVSSQLLVAHGAGHGFHGGPWIDPQVDAFLDRHLRRRPSQPVREWVDPNRDAPPLTRAVTFFSARAKQEASYVVYLPPDYADSTRRYPVIYWLHGLTGSQRSGARDFVPRYDQAIRAGTAPPAIIIGVNGLWDSMYVDSADNSLPVESVIVNDLLPHVDRTYRTTATREARAIEGFSMGGFGAAHLAFKHPDLFGVVSVMAGALLDSDSLSTRHPDMFTRLAGGDPARFDRERPQRLLAANADRLRGRTHLRIIVGADDRLAERNRLLHEQLGQLKLPHGYQVLPGVGHDAGKLYGALGEAAATFYRTAFGGAR